MTTKPRHLALRPATRALIVVAVGIMLPAWASAQTQATPPAPSDARPATAAGKPAGSSAAQRTRIELPPAERQALEAGSAASRPATTTRDELLPNPDDARTTIVDEPSNVIEQVRTSNRISEVRVTPALTGHTYIMTNREGRQPTSAVDSSSGLSLPKFFTFEFGRPAERPAGTLPPPPSSQSR